jgi:hypothetical protein
VNVVAIRETLARRRGRCRLCHQTIVADYHYVSKVERLGWVHSECGSGYRRVLEEHRVDDDARA